MIPDCREMTELSTDYAEGTLSWRGWLGARLHLAMCSLCRAYYDQLEKSRRLLRGRELAGPPPSVEARLLASLPRAGDPTP